MRLALAAAALAALASPARGGDVVGTVQLRGPPPTTAPAVVTKDGPVCGTSQPDESIAVQAGRVAQAVVVVKGAPRPPPTRATLDQRQCRFVPHVQAVPVGSTLDVANGDPILHSVRGWADRRTRFDLALATRGDRAEARLDRPGVIQVRCDVHDWMRAYVVVAEGPSAVTGGDGTFAIRGVPPGSYTVQLWHERLGERSAQVTVPADGVVRVDFTFGG